MAYFVQAFSEDDPGNAVSVRLSGGAAPRAMPTESQPDKPNSALPALLPPERNQSVQACNRVEWSLRT
jgi:hypothetical protein